MYDSVAKELMLRAQLLGLKQKMVKSTLREPVEKMDACISQIIENSFISIMKNHESDHNMAFVRRVLKQAIREIPMTFTNVNHIN